MLRNSTALKTNLFVKGALVFQSTITLNSRSVNTETNFTKTSTSARRSSERSYSNLITITTMLKEGSNSSKRRDNSSSSTPLPVLNRSPTILLQTTNSNTSTTRHRDKDTVASTMDSMPATLSNNNTNNNMLAALASTRAPLMDKITITEHTNKCSDLKLTERSTPIQQQDDPF